MDKDKKSYYRSEVYSNSKKKDMIEDTTEYGEFVSTFDAWLPIEEQKRMAKHMENLGD